MPYRSDDTPCPECGIPLGEIPLKSKCREHKLHEMEYEEEERYRAENEWCLASWSERYMIDPHRAFVELAELIDADP